MVKILDVRVLSQGDSPFSLPEFTQDSERETSVSDANVGAHGRAPKSSHENLQKIVGAGLTHPSWQSTGETFLQSAVEEGGKTPSLRDDMKEQAMLLAKNAQKQKAELKNLESELKHFQSQSPEDQKTQIQLVEAMAQTMLHYASEEFSDQKDTAFVRDQLNGLASETYQMLARFADGCSDPEIKNRASLYEGNAKLALGNIEDAKLEFEKISRSVSEAKEQLEALDKSRLRQINLMALETWSNFVSEGEAVEIEDKKSVLGNFLWAADHLIRSDGKSIDDDLAIRSQTERELIQKVQERILAGKADCIFSALEQISNEDSGKIQTRAKELWQQSFAKGPVFEDSSDILPRLIQYTSQLISDPRLETKLYQKADQLESQYMEYGVGQTALGVYSILHEQSIDEELKASTAFQLKKAGMEKGVGDYLAALVKRTSLEDVAVQVVTMGAAGFVGGATELNALNKLRQTGTVGWKGLALAKVAGTAAEGTALWALNTSQEILTHDMDKTLDAAHLAKTFGANIIMLGSLKGFGALGENIAPRIARALGFVTDGGAQLSAAGKAVAWATGHVTGITGMVVSTQLNERLHLQDAAKGGFKESLVNDLYGYVKFSLGHKLVDGAAGGKISEIGQGHHQEIAIRKAQMSVEEQFVRAHGRAPLLGTISGRTKEGDPIFHDPESQGLYSQLLNATLTRPGFSAAKLANYLQHQEFNKAREYVKDFNFQLDFVGKKLVSLREPTAEKIPLEISSEIKDFAKPILSNPTPHTLRFVKSPLASLMWSTLGAEGMGGSTGSDSILLPAIKKLGKKSVESKLVRHTPLTNIDAWLNTPPVTNPVLLEGLSEKVANRFWQTEDVTTEDELMAVQVLARGIFSDKILEYHQVLKEMSEELSPLQNQLGEKLREANPKQGEIAIATQFSGMKPDELREALQNIFDYTEERVRHSIASELVKIQDIFRRSQPRLNALKQSAQEEMEKQLEVALKIISGLDNLVVFDSDEDAETDLAEMVELTRDHVVFHILDDIDQLPTGSYALGSFARILDGGKGFAAEVRIRPGATLSEVFHELLHAADHQCHPQGLKDMVFKAKFELKTGAPAKISGSLIDKKSEYEQTLFFEEALAFSGQAWFEGILRRVLGWDSFRHDAYMTGDHSGPNLIRIFEDEDVLGVYHELKANSRAYRLLEIETSWRRAVMMSDIPSLRDRLYWSTEAGKWGFRFKKSQTIGGTYYTLDEVDLPQTMDQLAKLDPTQVLRLVKQWEQDQEIVGRGGAGKDSELLPDDIAYFTLPAAPREIPLGDPAKIPVDPVVTKDRIAILSKFRQLEAQSHDRDLAHFEALLAMAEQAPAEAASMWFDHAAKMIRQLYNQNDFEIASELCGRLGGALLDRGYTEKGKALLYLSLNSLLGIEGAELWFSEREENFKEGIKIEIEKDALTRLERLLYGLAASEGSELVVSEMFRLIDAVMDFKPDYENSDHDFEMTNSRIKVALNILPVLERFRSFIALDQPKRAKELTAFIQKRLEGYFDSFSSYFDKKYYPEYLSFLLQFQEPSFLLFEPWLNPSVHSPLRAEVAKVLHRMTQGLTPEEQKIVSDGLVKSTGEYGGDSPVLTSAAIFTPRGILDYFAMLPEALKGGRTRVLQAFYRGQAVVDEKSYDYLNFLLGRILARRSESVLREAGLQLIAQVSSGKNASAYYAQDNLVNHYYPVPYSPLAQVVMAQGFVYNPATTFYYNHDYFRAMAFIEQANLNASQAKTDLARAEKLLAGSDQNIKFSELPRIEVLLYALGELHSAYLEAGDFKSAQRVFKKTTVLSDEYGAQVRKMIQQGQTWLASLAPDSPVTHHLEKSEMENIKDPVRDLAGFFRSGVLPVSFDSVGLRLKFKIEEALASYRLQPDKTHEEQISKLIPDIEDDILYRKGHLSTAQLLHLLEKVSQVPALAKSAREIASLCARHFALQRGEGAKQWAQQKKSKLKGAVEPLFAPLQVSVDSKQDARTRQAQFFSAFSDLKEIGEGVRQDLENPSPDHDLWTALQEYMQIIEKSALPHEEREEALLDLMDRLLPRRRDDWAELWDSFPRTFRGILNTLKRNDYPKVEAFVLHRIAGLTPEMVHQEDRPGANSSQLMAMTLLTRFLTHQNPELLNPASVGEMLEMDQGLDYQMKLQVLFGDMVSPALARLGTAGIAGFPYRLGEVITGSYRWNRATAALKPSLDRVLLSGEKEPSDTSREFFRIYHEMVRQAFLGKVEGASKTQTFLESTYALIQQWIHGPDFVQQPLRQAFVERLLEVEDPQESKAKGAWFKKLLEGPQLPPQMEQKIMAGLHLSGSISDYIYNRYITEFAGAAPEIHQPFIEFVQRILVYENMPGGHLEDYFVVTLLEHPNKLHDFFLSHDHWMKAQQDGKLWPGDPSDPFDLAIFYFKVLPTLKVSRSLSIEEFLESFSGAMGVGESRKKSNPLSFQDIWKYFGHESSESASLLAKYRKAVTEFKNRVQEVEAQVQMGSLHLPPAILELPSVVQFVAIRYMQKLPLGVREDIFSDFMDPDLTPELAFRRMFERTGNEKLGQFLSLLKGALPERFRKVLKEFRGNVRGSRPDEIQAAFMQSWGELPEKRFESFSYAMKKAGSIGEVYQATLAAGSEVRYQNGGGVEVKKRLDKPMQVAVKILTPTRQKRLEDNLKILEQVAQDLQKHGRRFGLLFDPVTVFKDFEATIRDELDFRIEAEHAAQFSTILPEGLKMPRYFTHLSGKNIVVTEWVDGKPLDQVIDSAKRREVFDLISHMTASHVLEQGLYYEDPHPENILVPDLEQPRLIDFGRLGSLSTQQRENLVRFFSALIQVDPQATRDALLELTVPGNRPRPSELEETVKKIFSENGHGIDSLFHTTDELFKTAFASGYYVRPEFTQMLKAFLTLEGVAQEDPKIGQFQIAKYLAEPFGRAFQNLAPDSNPPISSKPAKKK